MQGYHRFRVLKQNQLTVMEEGIWFVGLAIVMETTSDENVNAINTKANPRLH